MTVDEQDKLAAGMLAELSRLKELSVTHDVADMILRHAATLDGDFEIKVNKTERVTKLTMIESPY